MLQLIFLIIFPFAVWKAWKNVQLAKVSTGWPTTTGKVTASETVKVMFRRQPRVTYSYAVNGAPFTSQRILLPAVTSQRRQMPFWLVIPWAKKFLFLTLRKIRPKRPWKPERRNK